MKYLSILLALFILVGCNVVNKKFKNTALYLGSIDCKTVSNPIYVINQRGNILTFIHREVFILSRTIDDGVYVKRICIRHVNIDELKKLGCTLDVTSESFEIDIEQ